MRPETLIRSVLARGARHVKLLGALEGALCCALAAVGAVFVCIVFDHAFSLAVMPRVVAFVTIVSISAYVLVRGLLAPLARSINILYVSRRIERAFPHFKGSLSTFVQMNAERRAEGAGPLVAEKAAESFEGVEIDAGFETVRFVRLGYSFVALVALVFAYSVFSSKSMWTSFVRIANPWAVVAAPTETRITEVIPGDVSVVQGSDVEISAQIRGVVPAQAFIRWSRDSELWRNVPMRRGDAYWTGAIEHVETGIVYHVSAGDATGRDYSVTALVPPVVQSVVADLTFPEYSGLPPRHLEQGRIEALEGTVVAITIASNKVLKRARLVLPTDERINLAVRGRKAFGSFTMERSGRYSIALTDNDGLSPATAVKYDLVVIGDQPPKVALEGPADGAVVGLRQELPFSFEAGDDFGLAELVFHFQTVEGNADAKKYILASGNTNAVRRAWLVPELLGARPGDTVSYHLEALDSREKRPNSSRTHSKSFVVASDSALSVKATSPLAGTRDDRQHEGPSAKRSSAGAPEEEQTAKSRSFEGSIGPGADKSTQDRSRLLEMIRKDHEALRMIARHVEDAPKRQTPAQSDGHEAPEFPEKPQPAETPSEHASDSENQGGSEGSGQGAAKPQGESRPGEGDAGSQTGKSRKATGRAGAQSNSTGEEGPTALESSKEGQPAAPSGSGAEEEPTEPQPPGDSEESPQPKPTEGDETERERDSADKPSGEGAEEGGESASESSGDAAGDAASASDDRSESAEGSQGESPSGAPGQGASSSQAEEPSSGDPSEGAQGDSPSQSPASADSGQGTSQGQADRSGKPDLDTSQTPSGSGQAASGAPGQGESGDSSGQAQSDQEENSASQTTSQGAPGETPGSGAQGDRIGDVGDFPLESRMEGSPLDPAGEGASDFVRIEATRKLMGKLAAEMARRGLDRDLLRDLGWQPARLRTFVRAYEEALEKVEVEEYVEDVLIEGRFEAGDVVAGRRLQATDGAAYTVTPEVRRTIEEASRTFVKEEVSERYRDVVAEYYKAISQTGEQGKQ